MHVTILLSNYGLNRCFVATKSCRKALGREVKLLATGITVRGSVYRYADERTQIRNAADAFKREVLRERFGCACFESSLFGAFFEYVLRFAF